MVLETNYLLKVDCTKDHTKIPVNKGKQSYPTGRAKNCYRRSTICVNNRNKCVKIVGVPVSRFQIA